MKKNNVEDLFRKNNVIIVIVLVVFGITIMGTAFYYSFTNSLDMAQKTMERNISDLKKQCNNYNDFMAADEAKSLIRLSEKSEDLAETLALLNIDEKESYIKTFLEEQRIDCLLVLDGNMKPDSRFDFDEENYAAWKNVLSGEAFSMLLDCPKKIYMERMTINDETYDVAAVSRVGMEGIVFCATLQNKEGMSIYYSPVRNLLATNETSLGGTLYITSGDTIIGSNQDDESGKSSEKPEIAALDTAENRGVLTKFECDGKTYYGGSAKYRDYCIYAFYPSEKIFSGCRGILVGIFVVYLLIVAVVLALHYRTKISHYREVNRQYEIIQSISHIYVMTVVVDVRKNRYRILKYPEKWGKISTVGMADSAFFDKLYSYIGEEFRDGYMEFLNMDTLHDRLRCSGYVEYAYQNVSGEWLSDKIIAQEKDENGEFHSYILARESIQEQKKAELENQQKLKAAARSEALANKSKTDFLRRMSHDIRTPINVILGMLEIAGRNPDDPDIRDSCRQKSINAAEYLLELVDDILTINKADAENADEAETMAPFNLADEVRKLYAVADNRAKAAGMTLEPPEISGENLPLEGNALYLRQIMMNIITNAVRYSHKGGIIRFSVSEMPGEKEGFAEVKFICEDQGIGMSEEFQKRMFEPFAQESDSSALHGEGVGLGLSIVQKLVTKLGGSISVDSRKNVGTRFEIVIPYKYADKPVEKRAEGSRNNKNLLDGLTILLVEDNELNMEIAEYMLKDAGAKIIRAFNGEEAVKLFAGSEPGTIDAVLTDMTMPVMDGIEETRCIRALDRQDAGTVPIIAMTANLFEEDMKACSDAGMTGFLPKPLNIDRLLETIAQQTRKE